MSITTAMRREANPWWCALLLIPFAGCLWSPVVANEGGDFAKFASYQLLLVALSAIAIHFVYLRLPLQPLRIH
jgi:hypothetical protein